MPCFSTSRNTILDHRETRHGREFLIKWLNYDEEDNSWEPECNLDGCKSKLQQYLRLHCLPYSNIRALLGAAGDVEFNPDNWISIDDVLKAVRIHRTSAGYASDLKVSRFTKLGKVDEIRLVEHKHHCYVLLHLATQGKGYIADGGNQFLDNKSVNKALKRKIKLDLYGVRFNQQYKADHCGASAVLITLEMIKAHRAGSIPETIQVPTKLVKSVTKRLHKHDSKSISSSRLIDRRIRTSCPTCGKTFAKNDSRKLRFHKCKWILWKIRTIQRNKISVIL